MRNILFTACICLLCLCVHGQATPEMVTVEGGSFDMGGNDGPSNAKPLHKVTISSFKMGKYVVTVKEFAAFVTATGFLTDAETLGNSCIFYNDSLEWHWVSGVSWRD